MKFLHVFMSFVLVFNFTFYQAFAQTLQFEREPVTRILHTALNSRVQEKGPYSLDPDMSEISWIPFEHEVLQAQMVGAGALHARASWRAHDRVIKTKQQLNSGAVKLVIGLLTFFISLSPNGTLGTLSYVSLGFAGAGLGDIAYGLGAYVLSMNPYADLVFPGEFDYAMVMEDQSLEPGYCSLLVSQSGSFEVTGCPNHPEILAPNQESQVLVITQPYRDVPFVVASGTLL